MMNYFEMCKIVEKIEFWDWKLYLENDELQRPYLRVEFEGEDAISRSTVTQYGRKWFLSTHMTESEIVQTAFKAVLTAVEHETRELFRYKGRAVYSPHLDVNALIEIVDKKRISVRA